MDLYFDALAKIVSQVQTGKLRAVVVTSRKRMAWLPNVPTVTAQGFLKLTLKNWPAFVAPKGTPLAVIDRQRTEIEKVFKREDFDRKLDKRGFEPLSIGRAELAQIISNDSVR